MKYLWGNIMWVLKQLNYGNLKIFFVRLKKLLNNKINDMVDNLQTEIRLNKTASNFTKR